MNNLLKKTNQFIN